MLGTAAQAKQVLSQSKQFQNLSPSGLLIAIAIPDMSVYIYIYLYLYLRVWEFSSFLATQLVYIRVYPHRL